MVSGFFSQIVTFDVVYTHATHFPDPLYYSFGYLVISFLVGIIYDINVNKLKFNNKKIAVI